jgi:Fur family transcriptional regulator, stress-responsive regulator
VTRPRVAVVEALRESPHSTVDALVPRVREAIGSVSVQAVYDVLAALSSAALVRRIDLGGTASRFELRVGDNHHHMVCRTCGTTLDVDCAVGSAPCLEPTELHGFVLHEADVTYWGDCPDCRANSDSVPASDKSNPRRRTHD